MTNNDILRRLRYLFDFNEKKIVELLALSDVDREEMIVSNWLKPEDDPFFIYLSDQDLAIFLNGLIMFNRGKKEGVLLEPESVLNNNIIFRKLRIALNLKSEDIIKIFSLIGKRISPHELSAFFRDIHHPKYRECMDQYLRNFLNGLVAQKKLRKSENK